MAIVNTLKKIVAQIKKPRIRYDPLIEVKISKDNLLHNLHQYQNSSLGLKFIPVLKSNAYGHGLAEVAGILDREVCDFLAVDSFYEALKLRQNRIRSNILVLGYTTLEQLNQDVVGGCSFVITSLNQLEDVSNRLERAQKFHLKIDTGMRRQGILPERTDEAIRLIKKNSNIILEGICSHFSDADNVDESFTLRQIDAWNRVVASIDSKLPNLKYKHISSTTGIKYKDRVNANMCRLGIGLYGIGQREISLRPALQMVAKITGIKNIKRGDEVGYGRTFTAPTDTKVATVAAGYYEGVDRRLSNRGFVKIRDQLCPIIGRVSMNISTIDVSRVGLVTIEDECVLISDKIGDPNSIESIASLCDTISYEILIHIPPHLRRTII